jgi:TIR domain/Cupin
MLLFTIDVSHPTTLQNQLEQPMSTTRARATHVFISYSHANFSFVQRLAADLKSNGITVWVDQSGLTPGTPDWETALRDAIGKAHAVILIASEDVLKSSYVKDELRLAHEVYHLPIYPVWVAGAQWINSIPLGWGTTQYIDARGGDNMEFEQEVEPGDFIYVPPFVPHQEINPSPDTPSQWVIVRNSQEPIVINLEPYDATKAKGNTGTHTFS